MTDQVSKVGDWVVKGAKLVAAELILSTIFCEVYSGKQHNSPGSVRGRLWTILAEDTLLSSFEAARSPTIPVEDTPPTHAAPATASENPGHCLVGWVKVKRSRSVDEE
jgi:hypothetical protein